MTGPRWFDPIRLDAYNPGPMTGAGNYTYLLVGPGGSATLIDSGVGAARHLRDIGGELQRRRATLDRVLVTHAHVDHASGASAIAAAHPAARFLKLPWVDEDRKYPVSWQPLVDRQRVAIDGLALVALHTPGHSPDHVAFWEESTRTAFSGDLVVQGSSVMIHASRGGDLGEYLQSLELLLSLQPSRLLPAHGPEITEPEELLRGYLEHRRMRERQVVAAVAAGHDTVPAIAKSIYDDLNPALMPAAHENVRAHLEKLRRERRAFEENGRWRL